MGLLDAQLQYVIFSIVAPATIGFVIVRWYFDLTTGKIRTWFEAKLLKRLHILLKHEKQLLFGHMDRLKFGDSLSKNPKTIPLHILEIGVGSGRNFSFYPERSLVTCLEPNAYQESYIRESIRDAKKNLKFNKLVKGFAEDMSGLDDNMFDVVVCTLTLCTVRNPDAALQEVRRVLKPRDMSGLDNMFDVVVCTLTLTLCTVRNPDAALQEARRVLKPGGKFFFLEHVASSKSTMNRWIQDRAQTIWPYFTGGCHVNRETWTYIDRADFSEVSYQHFKGSLLMAFSRPCMYGIATK